MNYNEKSLKIHEQNKGKIEVVSKIEVNTKDDLSTVYTPGVAEPCRQIHEDKSNVYKYTSKGNTIAVVSDGSAVLGLGNIGAEASIPVMEGKSILFKSFADVDAFPICLSTQDEDEIIKTVENIAPMFGGINLEDICSPKCFSIEEKLQDKLDIPVFHDDQHGTAVVVSAALINSMKLVNKKLEDIKVVINGPGSAGTAIAKMLMSLNVKNIIMCDENGILEEKRPNQQWHKTWLAKITNPENKQGFLKDALVSADVFIGVSIGNILSEKMIKSMNKDSVVFAMANPIPEITPEKAKKAGVRVIGTGRSDYPNQINNVLAFPGIFRGALDCKANKITQEMKVSAAYAIANLVSDEQLNEEYIIPNALDKNVSFSVAKAVSKSWNNTNNLENINK